MSRLILFGGTTESRKLLEHGIPALYCTATDWGAELVKNLPNVEVRVGRLDEVGILNLIQEKGITCAIDATHPYATEVTRNVQWACEKAHIPLLRVSRPATPFEGGTENVTWADSCREAAELLNKRSGKALLAVGSKELREFTAVRDYKERLFIRVLPTSEVLRSCEELGFDPAHIIAVQGPFSLETNRVMLEGIGASILVTKDSGAEGGLPEKLQAAREMGIEVMLVARPGMERAEEGHTVEEGVLWARRHLGLSRPPLFPLMLDLEGRDALVVGGGEVAMRRVGTLLQCGARVRAVSPVFRDDFPREATLLPRPFEPGDLDGAFLAVAASDDRKVNRQVGQEARKRKIPVSVADSAAEGSFFFPSLIASGEAAASVSTAGLSCALTRCLSDRLRSVWEDWVSEERQHEA